MAHLQQEVAVAPILPRGFRQPKFAETAETVVVHKFYIVGICIIAMQPRGFFARSGQSGTEYLLILGGAAAVIVIVSVLVLNMLGSTKQGTGSDYNAFSNTLPCTPPQTNLYAYWKFDEGAGSGTAGDSAGDFDGTLTGMDAATAWKSGSECKMGGCLSFDGASDYVNVPNFTWDYSGPVTVSFWINAADKAFSFPFIGPVSTNTDIRFGPIIWNDDYLYWDYGNLTTTGRIKEYFYPYFDNWTHVVLVSKGKGGNYKAIYLNGELVNSNTSSDGPEGLPAGLTIGKGTDVGKYYQGRMDEFMVYKTALSGSQIKYLYACGSK